MKRRQAAGQIETGREIDRRAGNDRDRQADRQESIKTDEQT